MVATGEGMALDWHEVIGAAGARLEAVRETRRRASRLAGVRVLIAAADSGREVDRRGKSEQAAG